MSEPVTAQDLADALRGSIRQHQTGIEIVEWDDPEDRAEEVALMEADAALLARWDAQGGDVALRLARLEAQGNADMARIAEALRDAAVDERDAASARAERAETLIAQYDTCPEHGQADSPAGRCPECESALLPAQIADALNVATADLAAAQAEAGRLLDILDGWRKHLGFGLHLQPDHACAECVPGGPIVIAGFQCAKHATLAALADGNPARGEWVAWVEPDPSLVRVRPPPSAFPIMLVLSGTEWCVTRDDARALAVALLSAAASASKKEG